MGPASEAVVDSGRIKSIDALRGFDMFWLIGGKEFVLAVVALFVNPFPEWFKYQLEHVQWVGFSAWDMVMPLFLFVVGAAMPFSFSKRMQSGQGRGALYLKIARRFVILWILGMIAQGNLLDWDLSKLHLYSNTLQAIACGYVIASVVMLNLPIIGQAITMAGLLVGYWLLMALAPAPGYGTGVLEPHANLAMFVDEFVLRGFRDGTTYTWILSSMGFGGTVLLGVMGGHLLKSKEAPRTKLLGLIGAGVACLILGWVWGYAFPIIKHIWTSSMVLWAVGWSYLLLAVFYGLIDMAGWRKWAFPFIVIGMNAIAVYMAVEVIDFGKISGVFVGRLAPHLSMFGGVLNTFAEFMVVWLILLYMYRKKTFIRV